MECCDGKHFVIAGNIQVKSIALIKAVSIQVSLLLCCHGSLGRTELLFALLFMQDGKKQHNLFGFFIYLNFYTATKH